MGKYRLYTREYSKETQKLGKSRLLTWIQLRCQRCGRFLSKYRKKYCKQCYNKSVKEWHEQHPDKRTWKERCLKDGNFKEYHKLHLRIWRNVERFNIGDYV